MARRSVARDEQSLADVSFGRACTKRTAAAVTLVLNVGKPPSKVVLRLGELDPLRPFGLSDPLPNAVVQSRILADLETSADSDDEITQTKVIKQLLGRMGLG